MVQQLLLLGLLLGAQYAFALPTQDIIDGEFTAVLLVCSPTTRRQVRQVLGAPLP